MGSQIEKSSISLPRCLVALQNEFGLFLKMIKDGLFKFALFKMF